MRKMDVQFSTPYRYAHDDAEMTEIMRVQAELGRHERENAPAATRSAVRAKSRNLLSDRDDNRERYE